MINRKVVVEYITNNKKKYYVEVNLRKDSMGIKNTISMLDLCYIEEFKILENLCYFLRCVHEIEYRGEKRVKFTRDVHHMAHEILFHIDFYILSEISQKNLAIDFTLRTFLLQIATRLGGSSLGILAMTTGEYILKFILSTVSKHAFVSDIGATKANDFDSDKIEKIYDAIKRYKQKKLNFVLYKLGKNVSFSSENVKNVKYKCKYGDVIIQKINNGKVENVDIRKLY